MSKVVIIAWREFRQTVFRKIFLLAIVGIPVLIVAVLMTYSLLKSLRQNEASGQHSGQK